MDNTRVELLRQSRASYVVAWLSFQKSYEAHPKALFCFFEGFDDPKYYDVRISIVMYGKLVKDLVCDGKAGVLKLRELIQSSPTYSSAWVAFFVDSDFDDNAQISVQSDIYVTPCYSVENFFVSRTAFCRLLGAEFSLKDEDSCRPDFQSALKLYDSCMESFCNATNVLNGWIFHQRRRGATMNLKNLNVSTIVDYSLAGSVANYSIQSLETIFPNSHSLSQSEIDAWVLSIPESQRIDTYRGKYLLQCYCKFIKEIISDRNNRRPQYFSSRAKVSLTLHEGNLISQLSQYADTPPCLMEFLIRTRDRAPL
jgi:hypothetical protein